MSSEYARLKFVATTDVTANAWRVLVVVPDGTEYVLPVAAVSLSADAAEGGPPILSVDVPAPIIVVDTPRVIR